ncbi:MAG: MFS transporter [Steroidobacteraceae bacterium]
MTRDGAPSSREWVAVLAFCLFAWTCSNLDQSLFGYAVPGIVAEFHIGLDAIGLILSIGFIAAAVLVVFAGVLADRFGRRRTLVALLAVSAIFVGLHGFARDLVELTVLRALAFGLAAGIAPITAALVAESAPAHRRGMLMGVLQCGYPLGWFIAAELAAPMLESSGWRVIFLIAFAVVPLALLLGWRLPESRRFEVVAAARDTAGAGAFDVRQIRELFGATYRRRSFACVVLFLAFGSAYAGTAFFFPTYFMTVRGYGAAQATQLVGMSYGIAIVGYLAAAYVGEYLITRRNTFAAWCVVGALALLGLMWLPQAGWQDLAWFALTCAFFYGSNAVVGTLLVELYPTRMRATSYAVCGSAPLCVGFALFPSVVPQVVAAFGWQWAFTLAIAPLLLLSAGAALVLPNIRSGAAVADF